MPIAPLAISMPPTSVMISSAYFGNRRQRRVMRRSRRAAGISARGRCVERRRGSAAPGASAGSSALPSVLPSSTPHWSKLSMPHTAPDVKTRCS